ncbi:unnamed protein product [Arctogadus glacialis]
MRVQHGRVSVGDGARHCTLKLKPSSSETTRSRLLSALIKGLAELDGNSETLLGNGERDRHRPRAQTKQTPSVLLCYEDLSPFCFIIHVSLILYAPFADREVEELHQISPSTTAAAPPLRMRSLKEEEPPLGSTMEEHGPSSWSF